MYWNREILGLCSFFQAHTIIRIGLKFDLIVSEKSIIATSQKRHDITEHMRSQTVEIILIAQPV